MTKAVVAKFSKVHSENVYYICCHACHCVTLATDARWEEILSYG
jgi:hypothetical protein